MGSAADEPIQLRRESDAQVAVLLARLEQRLDEQDRALARIEVQTTKTNGSVTELQRKEGIRSALESLSATGQAAHARHYSQLQTAVVGAVAGGVVYTAAHLLAGL